MLSQNSEKTIFTVESSIKCNTENYAELAIYVKYGLKNLQRYEDLSLEKCNFEMENA